jgi:hypothetical protein
MGQFNDKLLSRFDQKSLKFLKIFVIKLLYKNNSG